MAIRDERPDKQAASGPGEGRHATRDTAQPGAREGLGSGPDALPPGSPLTARLSCMCVCVCVCMCVCVSQTNAGPLLQRVGGLGE